VGVVRRSQQEVVLELVVNNPGLTARVLETMGDFDGQVNRSLYALKAKGFLESRRAKGSNAETWYTTSKVVR
jgi:hypothetical protein